eukprot:scaffold121835_cov60-Phaeocystis_antarctica.AAC.2
MCNPGATLLRVQTTCVGVCPRETASLFSFGTYNRSRMVVRPRSSCPSLLSIATVVVVYPPYLLSALKPTPQRGLRPAWTCKCVR